MKPTEADKDADASSSDSMLSIEQTHPSLKEPYFVILMTGDLIPPEYLKTLIKNTAACTNPEYIQKHTRDVQEIKDAIEKLTDLAAYDGIDYLHGDSIEIIKVQDLLQELRLNEVDDE